MKTDITRNISAINVQQGYGGNKSYAFKNNTLKYWYPLNINYVYKYSLSRDDLYLTPVDSYIYAYDYGIETKNRSKAKGSRFDPNTDEWYNETVANDNKYIMDRAKELGIVTLDDIDTCNYFDIGKSFQTISDTNQILRDKLTDRALEHADTTSFLHADKEEQDIFMYNFITDEEQKHLITLGKMYNMLVLIRKIKEA